MATFKSKLIKVLAMTALVFAAFSFTACGPKPGDGSGSGGGDGSGGGGDGSGGGNDMQVLTAEQKAAINTLAASGYEIHYHWESNIGEARNDEIIIGEKDNVFWVETRDQDSVSKMAVKKEAGNLIMYDGTDEYAYDCAVPETEDYSYSTIADVYRIMLFLGAMYEDLDFTDKGSDTIAGRACKKYEYEDSAAYFTQYAKIHLQYWKDNATGITMKLLGEGDSNLENKAYEIYVEEFLTGSQVTVPTLGNPPEDGDE